MHKETTEFMLVGDVAAVLRKSPSLIERLADSGKLPILGRTSRGVRVFDGTLITKLAAAEATR